MSLDRGGVLSIGTFAVRRGQRDGLLEFARKRSDVGRMAKVDQRSTDNLFGLEAENTLDRGRHVEHRALERKHKDEVVRVGHHGIHPGVDIVVGCGWASTRQHSRRRIRNAGKVSAEGSTLLGHHRDHAIASGEEPMDGRTGSGAEFCRRRALTRGLACCSAGGAAAEALAMWLKRRRCWMVRALLDP